MKFFQITPLQAASQLDSDCENGLRDEQIDGIRKIYGTNSMPSNRKQSFVSALATQLRDIMTDILLVAAAVSGLVSFLQHDMGKLIDAFVIIAIVLLNITIGALQQGRAERALDALAEITAPTATVKRGGKRMIIPSSELVPGDLMILSAGDFVPADGRIVTCTQCKTDEKLLSGENLPAEKSPGIIEGDNHSVSDLHNMVFSGSMVLEGEAEALVTSIGLETQLGKIAGIMQNKSALKSGIQRQMAQMGRVLGLAAIAICLVIFVLGLIEQKPILDMFLMAVALAVAVIPEGLTATVSMLLAIGVKKLAKINAVVRKLDVVETLGNTQIICTGKTGTLTENKMRLVQFFTGGEILDFEPANYKMAAESVLYGSMCNEASLVMQNGRRVCKGDPTEGAILYALEDLGREKEFINEQYPKWGDIPFDSERKRKTTVHVINGQNVVIVKGAPDVLYNMCNNGEIELAAFRAAEKKMAESALRVLAIAVKAIDVIPSELTPEIENGLHMIGLFGMMDPPRPGVVEAISSCISAGIRPIMITGDQVTTATAVAQKVGIYNPGDVALTGAQLDQMTDEEFENYLSRCSVYARVSPEQKVRIVSAWQNKGKSVVMTGDGINDAPALHSADIGCAMGASGTDVAKEASDIILLDDNFSTLVSSVQQGRGILNNISKTVKFLLTGNIGAMLFTLAAMICFATIPMLPIQMLWINMIILVMPGLALGLETARSGLMERAPRDKRQNFIDKNTAVDVIWQGILIAAVTFAAFAIGYSDSVGLAQTMAFAVLALSQIIHSFDCRSRHLCIKIGLFSNISHVISVVLSLALTVAVMLPGIGTVFGIQSLSFARLTTVLILSVIPFFVCEAVKLFRK